MFITLAQFAVLIKNVGNRDVHLNLSVVIESLRFQYRKPKKRLKLLRKGENRNILQGQIV